MRLLSLQLIATIFFIAAIPSHAFSEPEKDANLCNRHFAQYEEEFNIPGNLLRSISLIESGLSSRKGAGATPWPWTFNAQGKGYYFKTKQEAVNAVRTLQRHGQTSIDVGCMQINLYYHPNAFQSVEEAFEPANNIAYAAKFLKSNFEKHNSWQRAVAAYHSETRTLGHPYAQKVLAVWRKTPQNLASTIAFNSDGTNNPFYQSPLPYNNASLSSRSKKRRNSNIMIQVRQPNPSVYAKHNAEKVAMVENITQNVLHSFDTNRHQKSPTVID